MNEEAEVDRLRTAIAQWSTEISGPLVVAIDGHGAAGKSTIAARLASELEVALVHVDDFWRAASAAASGPPRAGQPMADYYDWERLRTAALTPLLEDREASFLAVDPDTLEQHERHISPAAVVVVEGVSAACEELADLVHRAVLIETPQPIRMRRLRAQIPTEEWNERWLDAERMYLATRPPDTFDLVLSGADGG